MLPRSAATSEENFEGNQCITLSRQFQTLYLEKYILINVLIGLDKAKGVLPEKENETKR